VRNSTGAVKPFKRGIDGALVSPHWNGIPSTRHVLNWTARIAGAAHTDGVSNKNPGALSNMKAGDVLVSHPSAVREHEISVIPNAPHAMSPTHDEAVSDGRSEAHVLGVDAWLTEDHTHVVKIAANRAPEK